jgi:hypothetical protein
MTDSGKGKSRKGYNARSGTGQALPLKPTRGGFVRPFGCGWFIKEFLLGNGPHGSPNIESATDAPQADIFHHYKEALLRATALERATRAEERRARRDKRAIRPEEIERMTERYLVRIPYKSSACRYHSFVVYFSNLQRLGWDGDWYRDDAKKSIHGELVQAGMERARQQGKRIGRPSVTGRDGFSQRFTAVVDRLEQGGISRRQAARELAIGYATLKRLLDTRRSLDESKQGTLVAITTCGDGNYYDDIMVTLLTKSLNSQP